MSASRFFSHFDHFCSCQISSADLSLSSLTHRCRDHYLPSCFRWLRSLLPSLRLCLLQTRTLLWHKNLLVLVRRQGFRAFARRQLLLYALLLPLFLFVAAGAGRRGKTLRKH